MNQDLNKHYKVLNAEKRVKEIKGFYFHLFLYLFFNIVWIGILFFNNEMASYTEYGFWGMGYGQISMALIWGVVLLFHWVLIFGKSISVSKKWEEKKMQEILNKENQRWE